MKDEKYNDIINEREYIPDRVLLAIQEFFKCKGVEEEINCYIEKYKELKDCKFFIYSDEVGTEFPECFKTNLENDFALIEIGFSDKYYAIDSQICDDIINGKQSKYNLDICVELDTQAISYLRNMFKSMEDINVYEDKKKMLYYLSKENVNYSSLLYMIENAKKITKDNFMECYLNLRSYEIFKNLDFDLWVDEGIKKYNIDENSIIINTDNTFNCIKSFGFQDFWLDVYDMQKHIYCLLAKAILIENNNSKKSADNKMKLLIEFINNSLGIFCEREMAICFFYFKHDASTEKFFRKAKANSKNIKKTISSMAWDLTHIRIIERLYDFTFVGSVKFGIHPILTYDNGLKDILKLYPVKKIAIYDGHVLTWYKTTFEDIFPEAIELIHHPSVRAKRRKVFLDKKIELIKNMLDMELN